MLKIGLFSLKDGIGCTSMTIHIANYLAADENLSVSVIEPKTKSVLSDQSSQSLYATAKADFENDGTFVVNNVRFYPSIRRGPWLGQKKLPATETREPNEDIQIYDFGKVNFLHEFDPDFDKLYLCTDAKGTEDELSFLHDSGILSSNKVEALLFGGSKEDLKRYNELGLKAILVPSKKEERIPEGLVYGMSTFLIINSINPPEYHKDWTYAALEFNYIPAPEEPEKKGLFGGLFGKKKVEKKKEEPKKEEPKKVEEPVESTIEVHEKKEVLKSNAFEIVDFGDIPAPTAPVVKEEPVIEETPAIDEELEAKKKADEEERKRLAEEEAARREKEKKELAEKRAAEEAAKIREENEKREKELKLLSDERSALNSEKENLKNVKETLESEKEAIESQKNALLSEKESLESEKNAVLEEKRSIESAKEEISSRQEALDAKEEALKEEHERLSKELEDKKQNDAKELVQKKNELAAQILADEKMRHYKQVEDIKHQIEQEANEKIIKAKEDERKYWEEQALHDEMTKLLNKKAFNTDIQTFDISSGALIFIDVNNLKKMNDTIGHEAGDRLITTVAAKLLQYFENEAYRVGGDEFIILTKCDKKTVEKKLSQIQKDLSKESKADKDKIIYSVACGIAYCDGVKDVFTLKSEADALMYENKRAIKELEAKNNPEVPAPIAKDQKEHASRDVSRKVKGLLGQLIKSVLNDEANVCGIYIVTKDKRLFIFDNPDTFFSKLELLKRELRDLERIHYIIITHQDYSEEEIITSDQYLDDVFSYLAALDEDLRDHRLDDDDIRNHRELILFEEVLIAN